MCIDTIAARQDVIGNSEMDVGIIEREHQPAVAEQLRLAANSTANSHEPDQHGDG